MLQQQKTQAQMERQKKLEEELARVEQEKLGLEQRELSIKEMREELERVYQEQAQKFINDELRRQNEAMRAEYEQKWQREKQEELQRLESLRLSGQMASFSLGNPGNIDMEESKEDTLNNTAALETGKQGNNGRTMGTRRKPIDVGRVPNTIRNRASNESSLEPSQFRI